MLTRGYTAGSCIPPVADTGWKKKTFFVKNKVTGTKQQTKNLDVFKGK